MKWLFAFVFVAFSVPVILAQEANDSLASEADDEEVMATPEINPDTRLGVKIGTGTTFMAGGEKLNPSPAFYLTGGLYWRKRFKEHHAFQAEFNISVKGSNFDNKTGELGNIKAYYADLPLQWVYGIKENNRTNLVFGAQYSRLLSAVEYKVGGQFPENNTPKLNQHDVALVTGVQFYTPFVGFQILFRGGLLNANRGLIPEVLPVNTGKSLHHFTFETSLIF